MQVRSIPHFIKLQHKKQATGAKYQNQREIHQLFIVTKQFI